MVEVSKTHYSHTHIQTNLFCNISVVYCNKNKIKKINSYKMKIWNQNLIKKKINKSG